MASATAGRYQTKRSDLAVKQSDLYFADTYEANRTKFRDLISIVRNYWPRVEHDTCPVNGSDQKLTIDVIKALPPKQTKNLIMFSTGLHGIEGYIGAAVQHLFVDHYLDRLNSSDTGLILVHAINPWGMKHHRRVNEHNVDLNRNFIYGGINDPGLLNPAYDRAISFLNPSESMSSCNNPLFYPTLLSKIFAMGPASFREAVLYGQYRHPRGLYYGGKGAEPSTAFMKQIFQEAVVPYQRILYLDMHSGYGPRYQMTLINSVHEKRNSKSLQERFNYPLVAKTDPEEFYPMQGDMVDYFYQYMDDHHQDKYFYGTSFEFGTLGEGFSAVARSLKAMINENRLFHYGAKSKKVNDLVRYNFEELFNPTEQTWRQKALKDARHALDGILRAEEFLK